MSYVKWTPRPGTAAAGEMEARHRGHHLVVFKDIAWRAVVDGVIFKAGATRKTFSSFAEACVAAIAGAEAL